MRSQKTLVDFFDSDVVANDELLTRYLARNKNAVLGEIIATIQKEQNAVIRRSPKMNLIVQGVAGSGKTTVAMHRISYILYNYEEEFRPKISISSEQPDPLKLYYRSPAGPGRVRRRPDDHGTALVRLLYEDWDPELCHIRPVDRTDQNVWIKGAVNGSMIWKGSVQNWNKRRSPENVSGWRTVFFL